MINTILTKIIGTKNERELKAIAPLIQRIVALEPSVLPLSDAQLQAKTEEFRSRLKGGGDGGGGESLDDLLPEAFAVVREAGRRVLNMRHFDVQLIGGLALTRGRIAERKPGEGNTLVATLAAYLNALPGKGVHVVTVNDYLAKRDSEWMGRIFRFLGLTVGVIQHNLDDAQRQVAYAADINYGTNNEFGFDYLHDNMKFELSRYVQRGHYFAVADEADSMDILHHVNRCLRAHTLFQRDVAYVDNEGPVVNVEEFTGRLMPGRRWSDGLHQAVEAKEKVKIDRENQTLATITFQNYFRMYGKLSGMTGTADTEAPEFDKIYKLEVLAIPTNRPLIRVENPDVAFRTEPEKFEAVLEEIEEYNKNGRPVLVGTISIEKSEHLSTLLKKDGIKHVVLNAKYHEREAEIVAQAGRFGAVTIATNMAGRGTDIILGGVPDYRVKAKLIEQKLDPELASPEERKLTIDHVAEEMGREFKKSFAEKKVPTEERHLLAKRYVGILAAFAPDHPSVLVMDGFAPDFPVLSAYLTVAKALPRATKEKIAKSFYPQGEEPVDFLAVHPMKADLDRLALAPEFPRIEEFLDTNERERVVALGGLHILATERHEARRIDNQLRGRAGRQGDPGSSRFYLSLEDDLMRIFGSDRISGLMLKLGMEEGVPIEHGMVTKSIERAQKQVEAQNVAVRKHLLEYDDVMNKQRTAVYDMRREILEGKIHLSEEELVDTRTYLLALAEDLLDEQIERFTGKQVDAEEWDVEALRREVNRVFGLEPAQLTELTLDEMNSDEIGDAIWGLIKSNYEEKEKLVGSDLLRRVERDIMLQIVDAQWKDHLYSLDHLKEGIGLRGYGQRDPLVEYKRESFDLFTDMKTRVEEEMVRYVMWLRPVLNEDAPAAPRPVARRAMPVTMTTNNPGAEVPPAFGGPRAAGAASPAARQGPTPARTGGDDVIKTVRREEPKVGRNDPCPCGSGKKYKKCHGQAA